MLTNLIISSWNLKHIIFKFRNNNLKYLCKNVPNQLIKDCAKVLNIFPVFFQNYYGAETIGKSLPIHPLHNILSLDDVISLVETSVKRATSSPNIRSAKEPVFCQIFLRIPGSLLFNF
jgi:hypothetical protein